MRTEIGPYEIIRVLGRGGMGVVYLARDSANDRTVAVKTLQLHQTTHRRRLKREFRVMSRISHPGIVSVYDYGSHDAVPYFVMEFVEGVTIRERVGARLSDPVAETNRRRKILSLIGQLCEAVSYVH